MKFKFHPELCFLFIMFSACTSTPSSTTISTTSKEKDSANKLLLGAGFGIETATVIVQDMDSASKYYAKVLGFKMPEKPEKGLYEGTQSAYVRFGDFSSFELLSVKDTALVEKKHSFISTFA